MLGGPPPTSQCILDYVEEQQDPDFILKSVFMSAITLRHYNTTMSVLKRDPARTHYYKKEMIEDASVRIGREKLRATIRGFITGGI